MTKAGEQALFHMHVRVQERVLSSEKQGASLAIRAMIPTKRKE